MTNRAHLFTDADNTLWDTDSVFATAQLEMLREIERITGRNAPDDEDRGLAFLRNIDQRIAAIHPDFLRYPPHLLARGLALVLDGAAVEDAVSQVLAASTGNSDEFETAQAQFLKSIGRLPPLRNGVREAMFAISNVHIPISVVTEERVERCRKFLVGHQLEGYVGNIVSVRKTAEAFLALRQSAGGAKCFMVGDQIDRDVEPAAAAGFLTFYFPGGFSPYWASDSDLRGSKQIARYDAIVPDILEAQT